MFVIDVYVSRPLHVVDAREIVGLIRRSTTKLGLPFGSHCVHVAGIGEDTFTPFQLLSAAGANVSLLDSKAKLAVIIGDGELKKSKHKQVLRLS